MSRIFSSAEPDPQLTWTAMSYVHLPDSQSICYVILTRCGGKLGFSLCHIQATTFSVRLVWILVTISPKSYPRHGESCSEGICSFSYT